MTSEPVCGSGGRVVITPSMLPVQFVHVQIGAALASIAHLDVRAEALCDSATGVDHATLTANRPYATLILPRSVRIGELVVRATPLGAGEPIEVGRYPLADRYIDITDCPTWGRQSVEIQAQFGPDDDLAIIDVRQLDDVGHQVLTLTRTNPSHRIDWRCIHPFRCAIEWRWHAVGRGESWPWVVLRRGNALVVNTRQRRAA